MAYASLLKRQLRKQFGRDFTPEGPFAEFLELVDDAYRGYEADQQILERSLEVSSCELNELNARLTQELKQGEKTRARLQQSQEKYQLLTENLQETVFKLSPGGFLQYVSKSILSLSGHTAQELEGCSPWMLFDLEEEYIQAAECFRSIRDQREPARFAFRLRHKNGTIRHAELTGSPLEYGNKVVAVQGTVRDVTERHEYEMNLERAKEAAEKANMVKGTFLSTISHEMRTPLHCILGFTELMSSMDPPAEIRSMLDTTLNVSHHLLSLINMLLDHAKIEAGKLDLVLEPFNLYRMNEKMEPIMRGMARLKALEISVHIDERVPTWVVGDSTRIRQVLVNIAGNAVKFTHEGSVRLTVRERERRGDTALIEFSVIDTGVGIPADKIQTIFESFTQVDGRTSRNYGGTGLGTTITKQLTHLMDGTVRLESTEGVGTNFSVTLPLTVATKEEIELALQKKDEIDLGTSRRDPSTCRILVAEDNETSQMLARLHLESAGYHVDVSADGRAAVEQFRAGSYDLVLTDLQMPLLDGCEAAQAIRSQEKGSRVPIVAMTANADTAVRQRCLDAGMDDVLTKPLGQKKMLGTVARWLNTRPAPSKPQGTDNQECASKDRHDIFCYKDALEEFVGNRKLLRKAILHFLQTAEHEANDMRRAYENHEFDTVRKIAHKLRGAAANITATRLQRVAGRMETKLVTDNPPYDLDDLLAEWSENWELFVEKVTSEPQCAGTTTNNNNKEPTP